MPSSVQIFSQAISDFKNLQSQLFEKQAKIGADSKASTFAELDNDITVVESFKASVSRSERFVNTISDVGRRLDTSYRSVDRIIELATSFKKDLILENSINASINDLSASANNTLDSIRGSLNAKDGSNFVFAGSKTNTQPVGDLKSATNYVNGTATANYYKGDEFKGALDVSTALRIEYGVTASDGAFKNIISAINRAKDAEASGGDGLEDAGTALEGAIDDLISLRAKMGNNAKVLEDSIEFHTRAKSIFEQKLSEKTSPDIVELSVEISQANAVLQASFQNFSRVSSLSLTDFI